MLAETFVGVVGGGVAWRGDDPAPLSGSGLVLARLYRMLIRSILSSLRGAPSRAGVARLRSAPLSSAAAADSAESPMRRLRGDDFDAFERIVTSRRSSGTFDASRPIALDLLRRIFELTLVRPETSLPTFIPSAHVWGPARPLWPEW